MIFVIFCCLCWVVAYHYLCLWEKLNSLHSQFISKAKEYPKIQDVSIRILAVIHAIILTTLSLFCAYVTGPWPFDHPGGDTTLFQELILSLSLSYFVFDLIWCLTHQSEGIVMLVHHVASILSIFYCVHYNESGTEMIAAIGGAEITNPLLQLRWALRECGFEYRGLTMTIVEYIFSLSFLFVRGVIGSYFLYCVLIHPKPSVFVKLGGFSIYIISILFACMIIQYMWRKRIKGHVKMIVDFLVKQENKLVSTSDETEKAKHR